MTSLRNEALTLALAGLPEAIEQAQGVLAGGATLVMRSGVSDLNDQVIGVFQEARTAELCGLFLLALDQAEHPEYIGFDLLSETGQAIFTHQLS